jgi:hypothetical protein
MNGSPLCRAFGSERFFAAKIADLILERESIWGISPGHLPHI